VVKTVPHDILLSYIFGHLFALVRPRAASESGSMKADIGFKRALAFQLLVFVPIGIFLLIVLPSWSFFYLLNPKGPLVILPILGILGYVAAMIIGYMHGASLAKSGNLKGSLISIGIVLAVAFVLFVVFHRRFLFVGTFEEFRALTGTPPINFFEPRILIFAAIIGAYFMGPLIYVLHRNRRA